MPPKWWARAGAFSTGQGRTDAADAHSVALFGTRMAGLRPTAPVILGYGAQVRAGLNSPPR